MIKRCVDLIISFLAIVILLPLLLLIALWVKADSRGSIIYRQMRVGKGGKDFGILKFRTMNAVIDESGEELSPQSTKVGKWLRKFRINEFPQLLNVIKGEMSLVGPRPDIPSTYRICKESIPYYKYRQQILPGLTGVSIIRMGHIDEFDHDIFSKRLSYDLYYVKNLNAGMYIEILLRTFETVLFGKER